MGYVLIVDDFAPLREIYGQVVIESGHTPLFAANGLEAIEILGKQVPDGIILDVHMPRMDGPTFLNWLRKQAEPWGNIPVIVSSGGGTEVPGANAYLYKAVSGMDKAQELIGNLFAKKKNPTWFRR